MPTRPSSAGTGARTSATAHARGAGAAQRKRGCVHGGRTGPRRHDRSLPGSLASGRLGPVQWTWRAFQSLASAYSGRIRNPSDPFAFDSHRLDLGADVHSDGLVTVQTTKKPSHGGEQLDGFGQGHTGDVVPNDGPIRRRSPEVLLFAVRAREHHSVGTLDRRWFRTCRKVEREQFLPPAHAYVLAKSAMTAGAAESKPTTSIVPPSFGSASVNPFEDIPTTISLAGIPIFCR
jgi:hypothetical protein